MTISITLLRCHHSFHGKQADSVYNDAAEAFCSNYALQCGACTPGFITSAHAAIKKCHMQGTKPTVEHIQQGLDGNLCRCTGYRPILDACRVKIASLSSAVCCDKVAEELLPGAKPHVEKCMILVRAESSCRASKQWQSADQKQKKCIRSFLDHEGNRCMCL